MAKKLSANVISMPDEQRWRVESDLRTLIEAEAIKSDSKRFAKVKALAKEQMLNVAKVASDETTT